MVVSRRWHGGWVLGACWGALWGCSEAAPPNARASGSSGASTAGGGSDSGARADGGKEAGVRPLGPCDSTPDADADDDGFSVAQGDCYDCDARINPGAFDFPDDGYDGDCRGGDATENDVLCDRGLFLDSVKPDNGARALGLCNFTSSRDRAWGVLRARYTTADGSRELLPEEALRIGLLSEFGPEKPREGRRMLALSSGVARDLSQDGYTESCSDFFTSGSDAWPTGYPRESPACGPIESENGGEPRVFDPTALELTLRVPTNARGLSFDTNFYTYEYPHFICSSYNDYFLVLMDPAPEGHADGNIVFDADGNWISVNSALLQVCKAGKHQGKTFECPLGTRPLRNTGYADTEAECGAGASTGWLRTSVPVVPGSIISLRFAIWDTDDPARDSTVLVDRVVFRVDAPPVIETRPVVF